MMGILKSLAVWARRLALWTTELKF